MPLRQHRIEPLSPVWWRRGDSVQVESQGQHGQRGRVISCRIRGRRLTIERHGDFAALPCSVLDLGIYDDRYPSRSLLRRGVPV